MVPIASGGIGSSLSDAFETNASTKTVSRRVHENGEPPHPRIRRRVYEYGEPLKVPTSFDPIDQLGIAWTPSETHGYDVLYIGYWPVVCRTRLNEGGEHNDKENSHRF